MRERGKVTVNLTHTSALKMNQPGRYFDGGRCLHLWIKSETQKYWIYRYIFEGKRKDMSIGVFPRMPLSEARKAALEARILRDKGIDPLEERKRSKAAKNSPCAIKITFEQFANEWIEMKRPEWKSTVHGNQWSSTFKQYVYPFIGNKALNEITTEDILKILSPIWKVKTTTAVRLRGRIENVLAAAKTRGYRDGDNPAIWRGHLDKLLANPDKTHKVKHHAAVDFRDLPNFMLELRSRPSLSALALEFLILTCTRTCETLEAKKSEVSGDIWTIPGERMKAGKTHRIPLPFRASQIIKEANQLNANSEYIFSKNHKPMSDMSLLSLLRRIRPNMTVHGFRSTFRDWVSETTDYTPELAEMAIAHSIASKTEAAYRRGDMLDKRRLMMSHWASYCQPLICSQSNINVGLAA